MNATSKQVVQSAYQLWGEGRIDELEAFIAPEAKWRSIERGDGSVDWCSDRDDILQAMGRAHARWAAHISAVRITEAGDGVVVSLKGVEAEAGATFIKVRDGRIVFMQDCRTEGEALQLASEEGGESPEGSSSGGSIMP